MGIILGNVDDQAKIENPRTIPPRACGSFSRMMRRASSFSRLRRPIAECVVDLIEIKLQP